MSVTYPNDSMSSLPRSRPGSCPRTLGPGPCTAPTGSRPPAPATQLSIKDVQSFGRHSSSTLRL